MMNTKVLMWGDWVHNIFHKYDMQIEPEDFFTHLHNQDGMPTFDGMLVAPKRVSGRDFEPVPLTKEILKLNGWQITEGDNTLGTMTKGFLPRVGFVYFFSDGEIEVELSSRGSVRKVVLYVHELQQALRLIGLSDIADTFKV